MKEQIYAFYDKKQKINQKYENTMNAKTEKKEETMRELLQKVIIRFKFTDSYGNKVPALYRIAYKLSLGTNSFNLDLSDADTEIANAIEDVLKVEGYKSLAFNAELSTRTQIYRINLDSIVK